MSKAGKIAVIAVAAVAVLIVQSGMLLAWTVATQGVMRIAVDDRESGTRFDVPVPAALVGAGLAFVPRLSRHHPGFEHQAELAQVAPAVLAFCDALEDAPDAVLVDVRDGEDWVRIVKSGRNLEVRVDSPDAKIRVSMPAGLLQRMVRAAI